MELLYPAHDSEAIDRDVHFDFIAVLLVRRQCGGETRDFPCRLSILDATQVAWRKLSGGGQEVMVVRESRLLPIEQFTLQVPRLQVVQLERLIVAQFIGVFAEMYA